MSVVMQESPEVSQQKRVVNDFNINVATVNGSGSQTSNNLLIRSLFKMGIPVTGKNLFPSNIQGLPTWFNIRLSKEGFHARREAVEVMICMNGATVAEDMASVAQNGLVIYDDLLPIAARRHDVTYVGVPVREMVKSANLPYALQKYISNMIYVGVAAHLLEIDINEIKDALSWNFNGKPKPIEMNWDMVSRAYNWAIENVPNEQPYRVERMTGYNEGKILIDGNTAAGLGALYGGMTFTAWYPITPSSSVIDAINTYAPQLRKDPETGTNTYAVVQAEDELAAAGMVLGAGWAGARAMTATSGPGISLMAEFIGLGYFAELPGVFWDIQRMGPSTGLPTRTSQGDISFVYYLSHGDTRHPILFPGDPKEAFEMAIAAFDLADRLQTPIFVLSDLDIGMNLWITDELDYPETPIDRGKVLTAEDLTELGGKWGRYKDVDGDGIPYRTLPGTRHRSAAYFTRGTGHTEYGTYSERPEVWEGNLERLHRKFDTARGLVPAPVVHDNPKATKAILSLGSNESGIIEARSRLEHMGIETAYLRLRALPINDDVRAFVSRYDEVYVIENNYDGQLHSILLTEMPDLAGKLISTTKCDGLPLSARWITEQLSH